MDDNLIGTGTMMLTGYDSSNEMIRDMLRAVAWFAAFLCVWAHGAVTNEHDYVTVTAYRSDDLVNWEFDHAHTYTDPAWDTRFWRLEITNWTEKAIDYTEDQLAMMDASRAGVDAYIADPYRFPFIAVSNSLGDNRLSDPAWTYRNPILIDSNVVVMCGHYQLPVGTTVTFEAEDGSMHTRTIVHVETDYDHEDGIVNELAVGWLDAPVPVEPVNLMPAWWIRDGAYALIYGFCMIWIDHMQQWSVCEVANDQNWFLTVRLSNFFYPAYKRSPVNGDSGTPLIALINGEAYLAGLWVALPQTISGMTEEAINEQRMKFEGTVPPVP